MNPPAVEDRSSASGSGSFPTTHWSAILAAGQDAGTRADSALAELCRAYWYPLYAFARLKGRPPTDSEVLTQAFFSHLIEAHLVRKADPQKGRFRSFLLGCFTLFLASEGERARAWKRGGGVLVLSIDVEQAERRFAAEPAVAASPDNDSLRCIVLRGAGGKAFAAGADIAEFATERANARQARHYGDLVHASMQAVALCRHPTVALIEGACVGGGLEIAAMCDMRICGSSSRFGVPINKLGLTMGYGELAGLLALVGRAVALEILLEGRVFDADEAYRKRLVNRVVADDQVETEAYALARRIADGAPLVARWHKQFIERLTVSANIPPEEWDIGFACFDTDDYHTGVKAFLAKTKPKFEGR